jgi:hypothetical protein
MWLCMMTTLMDQMTNVPQPTMMQPPRRALGGGARKQRTVRRRREPRPQLVRRLLALVFGLGDSLRDYLDKQTTRAQLEQEYVFMGVVSTFLRAIRAGAIHPRHGAVLLVHHGRLGVAFDHCSKIVVDILREEGMYKGHGDLVVEVITRALKDVSNIILWYHPSRSLTL